MIVRLYACRARPGQVEAIRALYHRWERSVAQRHGIAAEFLSNSQDPSDLIILAHYRDADAAWTAAESADYRAWYVELARLSEAGPIVSQYDQSA